MVSRSSSRRKKEYKVTRVGIDPNDRKQLEYIAKEFDCTERGRASIKQLLEDIATGRLSLSKKVNVEESKEEGFQILGLGDENLIELTLNVISDLNGTIALITRKIKEQGGNIYQAIAEESTDMITVIFSLKKSEANLIKNISNIKFGDVLKFNGIEKQKHFLEIVNPQLKNVIQWLEQNKEAEKSSLEKAIDTHLAIKIVKSIKQSFYFQIKADNRLGVLNSIAEEMALNKVTIISINQFNDYQDDTCKINLFAGVSLLEEENNTFTSIDQLKKDIENIDGIRTVRHRNWGIRYKSPNRNLEPIFD